MADIYVAQTGNDTTGDGSVGNPYATPGKAAGVMAASDTMFIKYSATPYSIGGGAVNTSGNALDVRLFPGSLSAPTRIVGYDTNATIGNSDANRPLLKATASGITILQLGGSGGVNSTASNLDFHGDNSLAGGSLTGVNGIQSDNGAVVVRCRSRYCGGNSIYGSFTTFLFCEVSHASTDSFVLSNQSVAMGCIAHHGAGRGFHNINSPVIHCAAWNNGTYGFLLNGMGAVNCVAYNNGLSGFWYYANVNYACINCISVANGTYGFEMSAGLWMGAMIRCATYGNVTAPTTTGTAAPNLNLDPILLSSNPFENAAGGDFRLKVADLSTPGTGAYECRAAGYPGTLPSGAGTGYLDIGALQHQDAGGGGSTMKSFVG
jgi:hypothetical protein